MRQYTIHASIHYNISMWAFMTLSMRLGSERLVKQICFLFFDALRDQVEPIPKFLEWSGSRESFGTFAFLLIYYFIFEEVSE